ncbi:hypothetical protein C5167_024453 [Papaver somniferum]|uniref:Vacuolar iron transporter n=1 Tax=Papaver somniferum TaxID=3469 RepID=A0A4Y7JQ76_PAPSO|nr:vacuolar iron transporter homolog 2-like [Papaver somniferum]RZC62706.1 hypothetical protein C5167_024453 [Papaver somniferum]
MASDTQGTSNEKKILVVDDDNGQKSTNHVQRGQWLRAAILGANDGLLSTTSLMLGIGAVKEDRLSVILSGLAGAVAGACSMAVGEFASVSTQRDIEEMGRTLNFQTKLSNQDQESQENVSRTNLDVSPNIILGGRKRVIAGLSEMAAVSPLTLTYGGSLQSFSPGKSSLTRVISEDGIVKLKKNDEIIVALPNPALAASASALAFLFGSFFPLATALLIKEAKARTILIPIVTSIALALFGRIGARLGGSSVSISAFRVVVGGWIAMGISYGILKPFHVEDQETDST